MTRPERLTQTLEFAMHPVPDELWLQLNTIALGDQATEVEAS